MAFRTRAPEPLAERHHYTKGRTVTVPPNASIQTAVTRTNIHRMIERAQAEPTGPVPRAGRR